MKWIQWAGCICRRHSLFIESRRCVPGARSEKINSPGISMASRQRRARVRAALSIALARSRSGIAPRERLGTFTIKRPWHAVLIALACFSDHANAKSWYYNVWANTPDKFYESADEFCAAYSLPGLSFTYIVRTARIHDRTAYNTGECQFFSSSNPDDEAYLAVMGMGVVDCEMPNSRPEVRPSMLPTCSCNAGYKLSYGSAYVDVNGLWANRQCLENSPPETPADRKCDAGLLPATPSSRHRQEVPLRGRLDGFRPRPAQSGAHLSQQLGQLYRPGPTQASAPSGLTTTALD